MPTRSPRPMFADLDGFTPAIADQRILEGAKAHHSQLGPGWLRGEFGAAPLPRTLINWWHVNADLRVVGAGPAGHHTLLLAIDAGAASRLNGHPLETGCLISYAPATPLDGVMAGSSRFAAIALPPALLAEALLAPAELTLPEPVDGIVFLRPERWAVAELTQFLDELHALARTEPELFDDHRWRAHVEGDALEAFGAALTSACSTPTAPPQSRARSAEIVARAEAWLGSPGPGLEPHRPSVADLCRAVVVGRRTLERAFHDMLGVSPAEHMRLRGLNAARMTLLAGGPGATVTRAAFDNGFWHLGRFSGWYRDLFGELPSETLHRGLSEPATPRD